MIGRMESKFCLKQISPSLLIRSCTDFHYLNLKWFESLLCEYITVVLGIQQLLGKCSKNCYSCCKSLTQ